jgi:integrase
MASVNPIHIPAYRLHKPTGQAVVTLDGRDLYLGRWNSKQSRQEYDRLVGEWIANGRRLSSTANDLTVTELAAAYWRFAHGYYRKNGEPTGTCQGIRIVLKILRQSYGHTLAAKFGPLALKALQRKMIDLGQSRRYINDNIDRIRRMFKWAVSEELLPSAVHQALQTVPGLKAGRSEARETPPVRPVSDERVEATLPHLPAVVADMVRFQRLTGARPAEVCLVRPVDVDNEEDVWSFSPASHKAEHFGRERVIFIGSKAQEILRPYLLRGKSAYCFVPAESERKRNAQRREDRCSPMTPSQAGRRPKLNRRRAPGDRYTSDSYRRAIYRGCAAAFPPPDDLSEDQRRRWRKDHQWHPNQLRHAAATEIRRKYGLEAAQVTLGHSSADVSQIYAERDLAKAASIMRAIG